MPSSRLVDLKVRVEVETENLPWMAQDTENVKRKEYFDKRLRNFLRSLDRIFLLLDKKTPNAQRIKVLANQMNRNLYSAYKVLTTLKFKDDSELEMWDSYQIARDVYYKEIRPNVISWEDLEIPYLPLFGESFRNNKITIAPTSECNELYLRSVIANLKNFARLQTPNPQTTNPSDQTFLNELQKLNDELISRTIKPGNKNAAIKDLTIQVNKLNSIHVYSQEDIRRAIAGEQPDYDIYQTLISEILDGLEENISVYKENIDELRSLISEVSRLLTQLYLMRLNAMNEGEIKQITDLSIEDINKLGLRMKSKAYIQHVINTEKLQAFENSKAWKDFEEHSQFIVNNIGNNPIPNVEARNLSEINIQQGLVFGLDHRSSERFNKLIKQRRPSAILLCDTAIKMIEKIHSYAKLKADEKLISIATKLIQQINDLVKNRIFNEAWFKRL